MMKKYFFSIIVLLLLATLPVFSQTATENDNIIVIPPLFEYPVAPEELPTLMEKTDYLMEHFWDDFDFKNKKSVDQLALNDAFAVYASSMPYASSDKVFASVKKLIGNIKNNPALSLQFLKAAEESLYGPRAIIWTDEVYMPFVKNMLDNKKIDDNKKVKYRRQYQILSDSQPGKKFPTFSYTDKIGKKSEFKPNKKYTLLMIGDPDCNDCSFTRLRLDINGTINDLLDQGNIKVLCIAEESKKDKLSDIEAFPAKWDTGVSDEIFTICDLRNTPSFYLLDKDGKIIEKNATIDEVIATLEELKIK